PGSRTLLPHASVVLVVVSVVDVVLAGVDAELIVGVLVVSEVVVGTAAHWQVESQTKAPAGEPQPAPGGSYGSPGSRTLLPHASVVLVVVSVVDVVLSVVDVELLVDVLVVSVVEVVTTGH